VAEDVDDAASVAVTVLTALGRAVDERYLK